MREKSDIEALIHKYLTGQATDEERQFVDAWLLESEENREKFEEIKLIWDVSESEPFEMSDSELKYEMLRFQQTISEKKENEYLRTIYRARKIGRYKNVAVAALAIIVPGLIFILYHLGSMASGNILVTQSSNVLLPDSSRIATNTESTVSFHQDLWKRTAELRGEGYFEVRHNPDKPFYVVTAMATIHVTGTEFNVRAYPGENLTEVTVTDGRVEVYSENDTVSLIAGNTAHVHKDSIGFDIIGDRNQLAWKTKKLVFVYSNLAEVLDSMEKLYRVKFDARDTSILDRHFRGTMEDLPLEKAVDLLTTSLNLSADYVSSTHILISEKNH